VLFWPKFRTHQRLGPDKRTTRHSSNQTLQPLIVNHIAAALPCNSLSLPQSMPGGPAKLDSNRKLFDSRTLWDSAAGDGPR
jgi:hypothetical protein